MYNVTLGDALPMIGSFGVDLDYTVRLKLRLRDKIDCDILKEAVDPKPFPRPGILHYSPFFIHKKRRHPCGGAFLLYRNMIVQSCRAIRPFK